MTTRKFAVEVTKRLQDAGYEALWAGGCVRDQMLGEDPKDYDVATSARPEQVRELFGHKRTVAIGASFGVITVLGPKKAGPIEVATFRRDADYSDGRRPDSVEFTNAREDAMRRDFTINGMFFDPIAEKVLDYVGGETDLKNKIIRAIGDPHERINEDKLRMLRAVRFASTYAFELDSETLSAVKQHAADIKVVSAERVGAEMRRMLAHPARATAINLLRESKLLNHVLENSAKLYDTEQSWQFMLTALEQLKRDDFVCAASIMLLPLFNKLDSITQQWKLSNEEKNSIGWICQHIFVLGAADRLLWSQVQPLLIHADAERGLDVLEAILKAKQAPAQELTGPEFCRDRLTWPAAKLNPDPFLDGNDLKGLGVAEGPLYGQILNSVRAEQLDGKIESRAEAIERVREFLVSQ